MQPPEEKGNICGQNCGCTDISKCDFNKKTMQDTEEIIENIRHLLDMGFDSEAEKWIDLYADKKTLELQTSHQFLLDEVNRLNGVVEKQANEISEKDLEQLFNNKSDCYADSDNGMPIQAMTFDAVKELLSRYITITP